MLAGDLAAGVLRLEDMPAFAFVIDLDDFLPGPADVVGCQPASERRGASLWRTSLRVQGSVATTGTRTWTRIGTATSLAKAPVPLRQVLAVVLATVFPFWERWIGAPSHM